MKVLTGPKWPFIYQKCRGYSDNFLLSRGCHSMRGRLHELILTISPEISREIWNSPNILANFTSSVLKRAARQKSGSFYPLSHFPSFFLRILFFPRLGEQVFARPLLYVHFLLPYSEVKLRWYEIYDVTKHSFWCIRDVWFLRREASLIISRIWIVFIP